MTTPALKLADSSLDEIISEMKQHIEIDLTKAFGAAHILFQNIIPGQGTRQALADLCSDSIKRSDDLPRHSGILVTLGHIAANATEGEGRRRNAVKQFNDLLHNMAEENLEEARDAAYHVKAVIGPESFVRSAAVNFLINTLHKVEFNEIQNLAHSAEEMDERQRKALLHNILELTEAGTRNRVVALEIFSDAVGLRCSIGEEARGYANGDLYKKTGEFMIVTPDHLEDQSVAPQKVLH